MRFKTKYICNECKQTSMFPYKAYEAVEREPIEPKLKREGRIVSADKESIKHNTEVFVHNLGIACRKATGHKRYFCKHCADKLKLVELKDEKQ